MPRLSVSLDTPMEKPKGIPFRTRHLDHHSIHKNMSYYCACFFSRRNENIPSQHGICPRKSFELLRPRTHILMPLQYLQPKIEKGGVGKKTKREGRVKGEGGARHRLNGFFEKISLEYGRWNRNGQSDTYLQLGANCVAIQRDALWMQKQ